MIAKSGCLLHSDLATVVKTVAESVLLRLVLAPCIHEDGSPATERADFVVIFAFSHVAGGGPTFCRLYSMMSEDVQSEYLTAERVYSIREMMYKMPL